MKPNKYGCTLKALAAVIAYPNKELILFKDAAIMISTNTDLYLIYEEDVHNCQNHIPK